MHKSLFSRNLKLLREASEKKQSEIAEIVEITASTWSNYEIGKTEPDLETLVKIASALGVSVDGLVRTDMSGIAKTLMKGNLISDRTESKNHEKGNPKGNLKGNLISVSEPNLSYSSTPKVVTVDQMGRDNVVLVTQKARAGYLAGYSDEEYIATLPTFNLPSLPPGTYRCFEADGVSMQPTIKHRDWVLCRYVENLAEIKDNWVYTVVTINDGIVIKRLLNRISTDQQLLCKSDNRKFQHENGILILNAEEIREVWIAYRLISAQLGEPGEIYDRLVDVETRLSLVESRLKK